MLIYSFRHIWEKCKCLDIELTKPFFRRDTLCGYINEEIMSFPELHNMSHCFTATHLTQPECTHFFSKMFTDLKCMMDVRELHHDPSDIPYKCHCPPSCKSLMYDTFYSTSKFPGNSLELNSAYRKIVLNKVVPYYRNRDSPFSQDMVNYFSNVSNRRAIMENFARFTLFIKDLTVQTSEQVPAYSQLDLLSDIGEYS